MFWTGRKVFDGHCVIAPYSDDIELVITKCSQLADTIIIYTENEEYNNNNNSNGKLECVSIKKIKRTQQKRQLITLPNLTSIHM